MTTINEQPFVPLQEHELAFDSLRPYVGIWNELLAWLHNGGDDQYGFNMKVWEENGSSGWQHHEHKPWCDGSVCCIGGYLDVRLALSRMNESSPNDVEPGVYLGMLEEEQNYMFFAACDWFIRPSSAETLVRTFLTTGWLDWQEALEKNDQHVDAAHYEYLDKIHREHHMIKDLAK